MRLKNEAENVKMGNSELLRKEGAPSIGPGGA